MIMEGEKLKYECENCTCGGIETEETKAAFLQLNDF